MLHGLLCAAPAYAYRPFDSTDADVTRAGEAEIEFGPAGYVDDDGQRFLAAPDLVVNYGVHPRLELIVEGRGLVPLEEDSPDRSYRVVDAALLAKGLLRNGCLQGQSGPSLAVELGLLTPTRHEEPWLGAEGTLALSQRLWQVTAHLNATTAYTRTHDRELGLGLILEGPARYGVRPALEGTLVREIDEETKRGVLAGLVWEASDDLAFDLGFRFAREGDASVREIRAGLTWSFELKHSGGPGRR